MKQLIKKTLSILLITVVAMSFIQCKDAAKQKIVEAMAKAQSASLPTMLNSEVRLDSCVALPNLTLKYVATMVNTELDAAAADLFKKTIKPTLINALRAQPDFDQISKTGVTYQYVYYDKNNKQIGDVLITPEDYSKPAEEIEATASDIESIRTTSVKEMEAMQKQLPINMGNGLTLVKCDVLAGDIFSYTYTVANSAAIKADPDAFVKNGKPTVVESLKNVPTCLAGLKNGFTFRYFYTDTNGVELCTFDVTSADL